MTRIAAAAAILLVLWQQATAGTPFPGSRTELPSPKGGWVLQWIPADQTASGDHELVLISTRGDVKRSVRSFPRHVVVSWSPDGRRFAVVDYTGSNEAESWVYSVTPGPPLSVSAAAEAQQAGALSVTRGADHHYVEADGWLDSNTLSVRVWGYGGPRPFDRRIRVRVGN
jgi:hypothetical protein